MSSYSWKNIASSSTGQILVATLSYTDESGSGNYVYVSTNSGLPQSNNESSWVLQTGLSYNYDYCSVVCSSDGLFIALLGISGSTTYLFTGSNTSTSVSGYTWTQSFSWNSGLFGYLATDSTGQYLSAYIPYCGAYLSTDYGSNWTQQSGVPVVGEEPYFVTSDSTGQYLAMSAQAGSIYYTTNAGSFLPTDNQATWISSSGVTGTTNYGPITSNGQNLALGNYNNSSYGCIYTSSNYGQSWNSNTTSPISYTTISSGYITNATASISMDSTGAYIAAIIAEATFSTNNSNPTTITYYVYTSSNAGSTWTNLYTFDSNVSQIVMASGTTGLNLACVTDSGIYISSDSGSSWTLIANSTFPLPSSTSSDAVSSYAVSTDTQTQSFGYPNLITFLLVMLTNLSNNSLSNDEKIANYKDGACALGLIAARNPNYKRLVLASNHLLTTHSMSQYYESGKKPYALIHYLKEQMLYLLKN
jgi:hypothetical protein